MNNGGALEKMLCDGARQFGVELDSEKTRLFIKYVDMLKEWNKKFNLTAIMEDGEIIIKHFVDSLSIIPCLEKSKPVPDTGPGRGLSLIDIGSGAGFPGIPVKIARPEICVVLVDSQGKRISFLKELIGALALNNVSAIHGRAEDLGINADYREKFDACTARAVAGLPVLLEYCLPFVKPGGVFVAMKGRSLEEVDISERALNTLGGRIESIEKIILPFFNIERNIIIVRKFRQTPTKYPRKAGKPSKNPIV